MKIPELVKTYKLLSDPEAPNWSIKFAGAALVAAVLVIVAGVALWPAWPVEGAAGAGPAAATASASGDPVAVVVAPEPETCDPDRVAQELVAWNAEHPGATLLALEPIERGGCVVGYDVLYAP